MEGEEWGGKSGEGKAGRERAQRVEWRRKSGEGRVGRVEWGKVVAHLHVISWQGF